MAVTVELSINGKTDQSGRYVTWAPAPCRLRVLDPDGATGQISANLSNRQTGSGGKLVFRAKLADAPADQLDLSLAANGAPALFFVAGRFRSPSLADGDASIEIRLGAGAPILTTFPMMVRIRKNAEKLTTAERNRFLHALARLNNQGQGVFRSFRATHMDDTSREAHGRDGFMPWHRAFLLDLERELQRLDPGVTLPYWRFDQPAPKLFSASFLGAADPASGSVRFLPSNPLRLWSTDGQLGFRRRPLFDPRTSAARNPTGPVTAEGVTVNSSAHYGSLRPIFEQQPHGRAHVSFQGLIQEIDTAAGDPLFYLLHCNVDRLWAKWQWFQKRFDMTSVKTYQFRGNASSPGATRIGHNLLDTMWPWNNVKGGLRPSTAPRTPFSDSPVTSAPGQKPDVRAMIDFQGHGDPGKQLGFDYDDVPYEPRTP
jgi:tyrosinase